MRGAENCNGPPPCNAEEWFDEACECCKPLGSPIIVDLDDNGIKFAAPSEGMLFDIFANGRLVRISWPSSERAYWLALDRNGNGAIDSGAELFGNATKLANGKKAAQGYLALAELDANADGVIDANDPAFSRLLLWRRPLPTGTSQLADEYIPLSGSAVRSILLDVQEVGKRDEWGNRFRYRALVLLSNGIPRWSYDVFLRAVSTTATDQIKK